MALITVYNVVIDTKVIVGIGPLLRIRRNDPHAMAYNELSFKFELYTQHYPITIATDPLSFDGTSKESSKLEYERIREAWDDLKSRLIAGWSLHGFGNTNVSETKQPFNE